MKIISACLVGINCKYNSKNNLSDLDLKVLEEYQLGKLIPVCPEQLGGLTTPRERAQIQSANGEKVLNNDARVLTESGQDITDKLIKGAEETLKIAQDLNIKEAIFKQRSPSCGYGQIYDGSFSGRIKEGDGVTTALLKKHGIKVKSEEG